VSEGGGGKTGNELLDEVITILLDDLIKIIHIPDVGCDRALSDEMSGSPAAEAGMRGWAGPGPVDIHWNDCWKGRHQGLHE
jgi:hypothetical protein